MRSLPCALFLAFLAFSALSFSGCPLRVVSWNVENLFDTLDDEGFTDEEFLPQGERRWNGGRYWRKLTDVARVVAGMSDSCGVPALIGLCEVENDSVVEALTSRSLIRQFGYDYIITHSSDRRGIDVALLYQPSRFRLLEYNVINVRARGPRMRTTRDLLHAKGLVLTSQGIDTLHALVVHLPSKAGGRSGDRLRRLAAETLWGVVDSLKAHARSAISGVSEPRIIVVGDFNATASDRIFRRCPLRFADDAASPGSYCFRGFWQWIDHVLLSASLETLEPARPFSLPWLLEENETYGGQMPRRTFRGPIYHGGVSDHLPVVADIIL